MVFKCVKGMYELQKNYRDAFNLEAFVDKYFEECFDKDMYIVGDISSEILRLKGFNTDPKSENYFGFIDEYLEVSCAFGCPYYVLKRIKTEEEFKKLEAQGKEPITEDDRITIHPMQKENFDKESLVLKTSHKGKPNIVIDPRKINAIPLGKLPDDLKDDKEVSSNKNGKAEKKEEVIVQTFVSSSEDFDPSKKQDRRKNNNNNKNKGNNNQKPNNNQKKPDKPNNQNGFNQNMNKNHNKNKNKGKNNGPRPQNSELKGKE